MEKKILARWNYEGPIDIGRGSFSQVYRVCDSEGRQYACKISREGELLEREGRILERLEHALFPRYVEKRRWGEYAYLFMEYVPGQSLEILLRRRGAMPWYRAVEITMELAEGLHYLHEQPEHFLYRDLKPENVLIREDGRIKLIDMGCVCPAWAAEESRAGTPGYAAPEQLGATGVIGIQADVYALGRLLLHMLTGRRPEADKGLTLERRGMSKKLHNDLIRIIAHCTAGNPRERIPNMQQLLRRLSQLQQCYDRRGRRRPLMALRRGHGISSPGKQRGNDYQYIENIWLYSRKL